METVEVRIIGEPKEIAALVVEAQRRQCSKKSFAEIISEKTEEYRTIYCSM